MIIIDENVENDKKEVWEIEPILVITNFPLDLVSKIIFPLFYKNKLFSIFTNIKKTY